MRNRQLGKSGFNISEVGLGCWQIGGDWGNIQEADATKILQSAVDNGITFFDTADVYGDGRSERLIGEFLANNPHLDIKVATKYGRTSDVYPDNYTNESLNKCVNASLERLQRDYIDLLQLHCIPQSVLEKGDIFNWLRELKEEGKIKAFGASIETIEQGLLCIEQEGLQSLQVIFNVLRQLPAQELFPKAQAKGVGIIVRLPIASGLLAGKFTKSTTFHEGDHRNYNKDGGAFNVGETFAGLPFKKGVELSDKLKSLTPEEMNILQMSLRWILDHKEVTTIIPGASSVKQVEGNALISELSSLSSDLTSTLNSFYIENVHKHIRGVY